MFSLGATLFLLLMGYPPFQGETETELMDHTVNDSIVYIEEDWARVSSDALMLVKNMLAKDPQKRLSMKEVISFPWVRSPPRVHPSQSTHR